MMKNYIRLTVVTLLILSAAACARGPVEDKRAPGMPGKKTYEVQVRSTWIKVTEQGWDNCGLDDPYPACLTQPRENGP